MYYLGVCAILKDEDRHIAEWLAYYAALGAEVFYLYDNDSRFPLNRTLADIAPNLGGISMRVHVVHGTRQQMNAYNHCLMTYGAECRWISFVDLDEFIVPLHVNSIPEMLVPYERHAGLAVNWRTFGTSGHMKTPAGLQLESFTRALPRGNGHDAHVKATIDPSRCKGFLNPHFCETTGPEHIVVDALERPTLSAFVDPPVYAAGQINHYYYRSREEYAKKLQTRRADTNTLRVNAITSDTAPTGDIEDTAALRFLPRVKKTMRNMRGVL